MNERKTWTKMQSIFKFYFNSVQFFPLPFLKLRLTCITTRVLKCWFESFRFGMREDDALCIVDKQIHWCIQMESLQRNWHDSPTKCKRCWRQRLNYKNPWHVNYTILWGTKKKRSGAKKVKMEIFFGEEKAFIFGSIVDINFFFIWWKSEKSSTKLFLLSKFEVEYQFVKMEWVFPRKFFHQNRMDELSRMMKCQGYQWDQEVIRKKKNPKKKIVTSSVKIDWILKSNWWWWNPW